MTQFSKILIGSLVMVSQYAMAQNNIMDISIPLKFIEATPGTEVSIKISDQSVAEKTKSQTGSKIRNLRLFPERIVEGKSIQCSLNTPFNEGNRFSKAIVKSVVRGSTLLEVTRADGGVAYVSCYSKPAQSRAPGRELTASLTVQEIENYFSQGKTEMFKGFESIFKMMDQKGLSHYVDENGNTFLKRIESKSDIRASLAKP